MKSESRPMLRRVVPLLVLLAAAATAVPATAQERVRAFTREYSFAPGGELSISNYKGTIEVAPWDVDEVQIHVSIEAEDDDGLLMLPHVDVQMTGSLDTLTVETDYRRALSTIRELLPDVASPRLPLVHLTVRMPRGARLRIEDYMSTIRLDGLTADVEVYTYKGDVDVRRAGGALRLDTYLGSLRVDFARLDHAASVGAYDGEAVVVLPSAVGFDLAVRLGDPRGTFAPDPSFAAIYRGTAYHGVAEGASPTDAFDGPVNGGGPRLTLTTHTGRLRLAPPTE